MEPSKNSIYNREGLLDNLEDISWPEDVEWLHKLSIDIHQEQEVNVNDDLNRELAFYTQAFSKLTSHTDDENEVADVSRTFEKEVPDDNRVVCEDKNSSEEEGDREGDELRKRIEDFIDKVNRGWKAERLRTSPSYVQ
ncbi:hypothetical protein RJ639_027834 [Escallonia herrerae]|uniref:Uncharacterized protein n=1 Tax=Escallonia herrerae TaxID=1293975 RepID=A0AA89BGI5_9ASTE|nr:hypothetical protein RJ639_027834 [Escallonia herrerae]